MIKNILIYPIDKEILTQKSENIDINTIKTEEIQTLIQDLKDTLHNSTGVGISAVQIGVLKRICIVHINNKDLILINPKITRTRGTILSEEGCLSAPNTYAKVERYQKVWVDYYNEEGKLMEIADGGLCSIIIQHELDHFEGGCVVFDKVDKIETTADNMAAALKNGEV